MRVKSLLALMLLVVVALSSCLAPLTPVPPGPPALPATPQAATAAPGATPETGMVTTVSPTAEALPTEGPEAATTPSGAPPAEQVVVFPPNSDTVTLQGKLGAGGSDLYRVNGQAGQTMAVHLDAASGQLAFGVMGVNGTMLSEYTGRPDWTGVLTSTQDYMVDVHNFSADQSAYGVRITLTPQPTPAPTEAPPTPAPTQAQPPPTPALAQAAPPAAAAPAVGRISFSPGATSATVKGQLPPRGLNRWVINVSAGRTLAVQLAYVSGQAILVIYGADGNVLISDHAGATQWSGQVPTTQDYYIDVRSVSDLVTNYTLTTTIPPVTPSVKVQRINFAQGATSATVKGQVAAGAVDRWVIKAGAGQTMSVRQNGSQLVLAVWGADGTVLLSQMAGATSWSGVLPTTQDYNIDVIGPASGATDYSLTVTIPPAAPPGLKVQRINFAQGATSATVKGQVAAGAVDRWVIKAGAGQTMSVRQNGSQLVLAVWGADGTVLLSQMAGATSWSGVLPATQDYNIDVIGPASGATDYSLTVTIPPLNPPGPGAERINFAPGAISATVRGTAGPNTDHWVIKAGGGQIMTAQLTPAGGQAILAIWGADGTVLMSSAADATSWSGELPMTQDYYIDVLPGSSASTRYSLTVTIPPG